MADHGRRNAADADDDAEARRIVVRHAGADAPPRRRRRGGASFSMETRFVSSRSTLEGASSYFRSLLTRWDGDSDEPLFIDCDADAFQVLLSYMRIGTLMLPQHDEASAGARCSSARTSAWRRCSRR